MRSRPGGVDGDDRDPVGAEGDGAGASRRRAARRSAAARGAARRRSRRMTSSADDRYDADDQRRRQRGHQPPQLAQPPRLREILVAPEVLPPMSAPPSRASRHAGAEPGERLDKALGGGGARGARPQPLAAAGADRRGRGGARRRRAADRPAAAASRRGREVVRDAAAAAPDPRRGRGDPARHRLRGRRSHRHRQAGRARGASRARRAGRHAGQRAAAPLRRQRSRAIGGRLRPGHRAPHRQGHLGPPGGGQDRRGAPGPGARSSPRTTSSGATSR